MLLLESLEFIPPVNVWELLARVLLFGARDLIADYTKDLESFGIPFHSRTSLHHLLICGLSVTSAYISGLLHELDKCLYIRGKWYILKSVYCLVTKITMNKNRYTDAGVFPYGVGQELRYTPTDSLEDGIH